MRDGTPKRKPAGSIYLGQRCSATLLCGDAHSEVFSIACDTDGVGTRVRRVVNAVIRLAAQSSRSINAS